MQALVKTKGFVLFGVGMDIASLYPGTGTAPLPHNLERMQCLL